MNQVKLHLDWCSHKAAKFAVMNWHYSKVMPVGKLAQIGVWENDKFIGAIIFGMGAAKDLGSPLGLVMFEYCELVRVALSKHQSEVSKILSIAISLLRKQSPKLKAIISFADPEHNHLGIIYQASNWIYCGVTCRATVYELNGRLYHNRVANPGALQFGRKAKAFIGKSKALKRLALAKYRYVYVLDKSIKKQIGLLRKPYPKTLCGDIVKEQVSLTSEKVAV